MTSRFTALRLSTAAIAVATAFTPAMAQDADDAVAADSDVIVVTGSRIARDPNEAAPAPIATVSADAIRQSGVIDTAEALRELPALTFSTTIADSIDGLGTTRLGVASLNLRGLGSARTLVLVNGRRHVSAVAGEQIVDIETIPTALIDQVEVLTGGASAVYGADAVTGVVNFNLKDDFEGAAAYFQVGLSEEGDGFTESIEATFGKNFADGRGNVSLSGGYSRINKIALGDRDYTRDNFQSNAGPEYGNPLRRFQQGDITAGATPNFAALYTTANGLFPYGFSIPGNATEFAELFESRTGAAFGGSLTAEELALIERADGAPSNAYQPFPVFAISSTQGLVFRNDFGFFNADVNNNNIQDCEESYIGFTGFGGGGCYVTTPGGGVRIFEDGVIASGSNQFGGDGAEQNTNRDSLIPKDERYFTHLSARYEFSPAAEVFLEAKFVQSTTEQDNFYNTFYDSLLIPADNPFIPTVLQGDADEAGGLRLSRDFTDLGLNRTTSERETYRLVAGLAGEMTPSIGYELSVNYGRTDIDVRNSRTVLPDRLFAAIDAVDEGEFLTGTANGNIVCRSDLDDTPYPGSEIFPFIQGGFFTFSPGDGQCAPTSLFNGRTSVSTAAADFITTPTETNYRVQQAVLAANIFADLDNVIMLPGGAPAIAIGTEFRIEDSSSRFDPLVLGILPVSTPAGAAGSFIGDVSANQSLTFNTTRTFNTGGDFTVADFYGELRLPILADMPFAEQLQLEGAARYSDYSTVGGTFTWTVNGIYAPIEDIRFRGGYSQAVRAPNISELFDPVQGAVFRPEDPCDQNAIDARLDANDPNVQTRIANCNAERASFGLDTSVPFFDPLSARFDGTSGGNPNLQEETAKTWTAGVLVQPRFVPGLTLSVDYYNIEIEDAISAVSAQDIVDSCYDSTDFPNQFCSQFDRRADFGFSFLRQSQLNFGRIETAGVELSARYGFNIGENEFNLRTNVGWVDKLNFFFDPTDLSNVDPELQENGRPEWSGTMSATYSRGPVSLTYGLQYLSDQLIRGVEIETADTIAGPAGFGGETFVHDATVAYDVTDAIQVYAGVNNFTDVEPFRNNSAYPVSPYGRYYFFGVSVNTDALPF
ncbi:MAG: TonB-dependent receptor [Pacificimonas sp.]|jgi:outer membrane receptor protein involved in Fe transport|nr:TonB-dependent receptor [Pacificimonas sp.]